MTENSTSGSNTRARQARQALDGEEAQQTEQPDDEERKYTLHCKDRKCAGNEHLSVRIEMKISNNCLLRNGHGLDFLL